MKERLIRKLLDTVIEMLTKEGSGLLVKTIIDDVVDVLENRLEADPTIFSKALMAASIRPQAKNSGGISGHGGTA